MNDNIQIREGLKASNITIIANICLMISKIIVGLVAKSTAIIADAFNNGTDIFASIAVFGGLKVAYLPPDENHHYGHIKAEPIVSKLVALIITATGITIGLSAIKQIISKKSEIPDILAIMISLVSILVKYSLYRYTNKIGRKINSSSIIADSYNQRSDVLASFAALLGVGGARLGFPILDPIAGLAVALIIFKTGISIYIEAIDALMDTAPSKEVIEKLKNEALNTDGVLKVNQIKARKFGPKYHVDLKICVDKDISVEKGHEIASLAKQKILNDIEEIQDVMIHVNPCSKSDIEKKPVCEKCSKN